MTHSSTDQASFKEPSPQGTSPASAPLAYRVVASYRHDETRPLALATAMHILALDARHPVALEIARAEERCSFQMRATDQVGLRHLAAQVRTRYPQADLVPLDPQDDPLLLRAGEAVSVVELCTGAPAYLPLRTFAPALPETAPEADPLLSILAALDALPPGVRAVCQLALVPAPANWSRQYQRKAIEHALDPERQREQWKQRRRERERERQRERKRKRKRRKQRWWERQRQWERGK